MILFFLYSFFFLFPIFKYLAISIATSPVVITYFSNFLFFLFFNQSKMQFHRWKSDCHGLGFLHFIFKGQYFPEKKSCLRYHMTDFLSHITDGRCINTHSPFQSNGFNSKSRNVVSNDNKSCSNHQLSVPDLTWGWRLYLFLQGHIFIYVNTDMGIERFLFLWRGRWRRHVKKPGLFGCGVMVGYISSSPLNTNKYGS